MSVRSGQSVTTEFTTRAFATGAATDATGTPTGTLYVNGTANAATVTVTNQATGVYKAAVTLPTLAVGDVVSIIINATVSGVTDNAKIWEDSKDVFAGAIPDVVAGGSGGILISGSNSGTTTLGALTVTGAVSFGSTFSTTGTTTFNAFTVTNATTLSGAVSLGSTLGVTGTTTLAAVNTGAIGTGNLTITGTLSTSGMATFNALTVTNGFTVSGATTFTGAISGTNASNDLRGILLQATQTGVTIPTVTTVTNQLTAAQIATGVWQDTTAGDFTVASSIGKSLYTTGNAPGAASGLAIVGSNMGTVTSVSGAVGSVTGNVGGNVVGSVGSVTGDIGGLAAGAITDVENAVWDTVLASHLTAGSTGYALNAAGSAGDPWGTALPGAYSAGTAGFILGTNLNTTVSSRLAPTTAGRTLDVTATGAAGIDWANVENPTTTLALTGTTIATTQKVDVETIKTNPVVNGGTITFPTGATLASTTNITAGTITTVSGNVTGSVGSIATGGIAAASFAAGAIDAAALAADAVAEIWAYVGSGATTAFTMLANTYNATVSSANGSVNDAAATTTSFKTTLTEVSNFWNDALLVFTSGALTGQSRPITTYTQTNGVITFDEALTSAPANGVTFVIQAAHIHPVSQIATGIWQDTTAGDFTVSSSIGKSLYTSGNAPGASSGLALVGSNMGTVSSVSGAVGSVTGNVGGNVTGSVGSVTGLTNATIASAVLTTAMTESYNTDGSAATLAQACYVMMQIMTEISFSSTTATVKKLDGSTTAFTLTINDATTPTSITRAT